MTISELSLLCADTLRDEDTRNDYLEKIWKMEDPQQVAHGLYIFTQLVDSIPAPIAE